MLSLGRLKPGVTIAQAQSQFDVVSLRLARQYPASDKDISIRVMDERLSRPIPYANSAFVMFSVAFLILGALVLLLACTNIANILMSSVGRACSALSICPAFRFGWISLLIGESSFTLS